MTMKRAMPPSTAIAASTKRSVSASPRKTIPPSAASTGTTSCTVAAVDAPNADAELAAWTVVGNVLFNLDETVMKR